MRHLRYERPAQTWLEALPIGNGLLGAMLFGGTVTERIQINDGTAWSGSVLSEQVQPVTAGQAREALAEARAALDRDDYAAADRAVRRLQHRHAQAYLPFADLHVRLSADGLPAEYERRLDLATATHETRYVAGGALIRQSAFASYPDRVLVYRVSAERPVDVVLSLSTPLRPLETSRCGDDTLALAIQLPSDVPAEGGPVEWDPAPGASLRGAIVVAVRHNGGSLPPGQRRLTGVTRAELFIATATTFDGIARPPRGDEHTALATATETAEAAARLGAQRLVSRHLTDYRALFDRVRWDIPDTGAAGKPTDSRLLAANAHPDGPLAADPALAPLLFDYGRYLLICSSRPGGTPANLQGIWNDQLRPPWNCEYTTNINLEMNYWPADVANLPECFTPFTGLIEGLSRTGAQTASRLYDAPGWVAHHNADIWGYSQPVGGGQHNPKWAFWPFAGVWLVLQMLDHVAFGARSGDDTDSYVAETAWPLARSAAEFVLSWLVPADGGLGTAPSTSPENEFFTAAGAVAAVARSSSMDLSLSRALLQAVSSLGPQDDPVVARARAALPLIPEPRNGQGGLVREWWHDPVATEPHHRHQSHLWAVYPGTEALPEPLAQAATRSLDARGDESTGWSLAWRVALRARLRQPAAVSRLLALVFRDMTTSRGEHAGGLYPNLLAAHPPFQIDGNFGYVAAVAECLLHSHAGRINLLPAVPPEFGAGTITGLVARPGIEVDLCWTGAGSLISARLRPLTPGAGKCQVVSYRDRTTTIDLTAGAVTLTPGSFG
jgi:alpha-L-fucosidase 2